MILHSNYSTNDAKRCLFYRFEPRVAEIDVTSMTSVDDLENIVAERVDCGLRVA